MATVSDRDEPSTNFGDALAKVAGSKQSATPTNKSTATAIAEETTDDDANSEPAKIATDESTEISSGTARRAAAARAQGAHFEPVKFQGIAVGKTSKHELIAAWGQPSESNSTSEGEVLEYHKSPFKSVELLVDASGAVASIKITLAAPLEPHQLAAQLGLDHIDPVIVSDETDTPICQAFPERGVLLMFDVPESVTPVDETTPTTNDSQQVAHVVLQPIDACAFAFRAENRLHGPYTQNINDLKTAISLDPELARAYWLLARIYLATGQADLADTAAAEACDIEPKNASFQLCHAKTRELLAEYDDAVLMVRAVLDREDLIPIDRARGAASNGAPRLAGRSRNRLQGDSLRDAGD